MLSRVARNVTRSAARFPAARTFFIQEASQKPHPTDKDVVIPDLVDTLEWALSSPPPLHQFEEPPIIVEIEHLIHAKGPEHH